MPTRSAIVRSLACCLILCLGALPALAQKSAAAEKSALAGHWAGIFDVVHGDGSVDPGSAYVSLEPTASGLSGGAGDAPTHLSPILSGQFDATSARFTVAVNPQLQLQFTLKWEGDTLRGNATGLPLSDGDRVVVELARADGDWHPSMPVAHKADHLYENVATLDARLFGAYNSCDLATMSDLVDDGLEFYHDKTGLTVGKQVLLDAIRNNICGKTQRVLTPGTLEVHRLNHYGAVEIGRHRFIHPGHTEIGVGEAKFISVWQYKYGRWKLTRAISYDHEPAKP